MSWIKENCANWFELFCLKVVKTGGVPRHIAFIMDGNRRYARRNNVKCDVGHKVGFDKLSETLKWCLDLGVSEVSVYAFSIENFKRTVEEVNTLMNLAREKFNRLLDETEEMAQWGVAVNVAGNIDLLPADLQISIAKCITETSSNNKLRLNVAYAYTGRDEIARAISDTIEAMNETMLIEPNEITADLLTKCMDLSKPELLIRTSGEVRLSDFMLWQISDTILYFTETLWPDFTIWNLLAAILHYQRYKPADDMTKSSHTDKSERIDTFLEHYRQKRAKKLEAILKMNGAVL